MRMPRRAGHGAGAVAAALLAASAALAAGVAGCSAKTGPDAAGPVATPITSVAGSDTTPPSPGVHWSDCDGTDGPVKYQCATIEVPRDPANPSLGDIGLALDRRPASGARIGSLLVNPGGPGASGVDYLPDLVSSMPSSLLARFDVVGFDPPGVGHTAPVTCVGAGQLAQYFHQDPAPTTTAGFNALVATDRTFAQGCRAQSGTELPYVSTVDAAMDMDLIRQALGDPKLTYLGFSYGTFLGATYAELFPTHVRAMVLDGALNPALPALTELDQQSAALGAGLDQFFADCASRRSCPWKPGSDPEAAYQALVAKVRASPLPAKGTSRTVGPSELLFGTAAALYSQLTWPDLAAALAQASSGNGTDFLLLFDSYTGRNANGSYSNLLEANASVDCMDTPAPSLEQIQAGAAAAEAASPVFGLQNLYSAVGCSVWPIPATGRIGPVHDPGAPPILVVGSTGDPITPYAWAQALASQLSGAVLLTRTGYGHTGYPNSSCVRSAADIYLITLQPPRPGTRCASD